MTRGLGSAKKVAAIGLIVMLIAGFVTPVPLVLAGSMTSVLQAGQTKDKKVVAIETIQHVIDGLKKLREFLSTKNVPAEALSALDLAVKNLESTLEVLRSTGDIKAAEAALRSSAKKSESATRSAPGEDRKEENESLRRAMERALERADELAKEVAKLENATLRAQLTADIGKARTLLNQAKAALDKGDNSEAARLLGDAAKILGNVNAAFSQAKADEKVGGLRSELQERVREQISELKKKIAKLRDEISRAPIPDALRKELLTLLDEAGKLIQEAEAALASGDINAAVSKLGKALAVTNQVEAKFKIAARDAERVNEDVERVTKAIEEVRKKLRERTVAKDVEAKVNELLNTALKLVQEARDAIARGDFGEANSSLARAKAIVKQAEDLLERGEKGVVETKQLELKGKIAGRSIELEFENKGDQPVTIVSVKILDSGGKEVKVDWKTTCTTTLDKGGEVKCTASGDFQKGQSYRAVIEAKKADESTIFTIDVSVVAK